MATLAAVTNMPALGLLAQDGGLEHSTEPFRRWYKENEELCKQSPDLQRVIDGQANASVLKLDGLAVDIAAVSDRGGARHVLITLPTDELPSLGDAGGALLDGALDESRLREVQRRREWPTRLIQSIQTRIQKRVIAAALDPDNTFRIPLALRLLLSLPGLRDLPARVIGFGFKRVHV